MRKQTKRGSGFGVVRAAVFHIPTAPRPGAVPQRADPAYVYTKRSFFRGQSRTLTPRKLRLARW